MKKNNHCKLLEWPSEDLQAISKCPVCGSCSKKILHEMLTDKVFYCAPGQWDMYTCISCESAYINPQPTPESIGLAYESYYTHNEIVKFKDLSVVKKIRRILSNGYRNFYFGSQEFPASFLGVVAAKLSANGGVIIDSEMRHLPKINSSKRLLDLGCGSGKFLLQARSAGWEVFGADFDPKVVKLVREKGIDVRLGGLERFDKKNEKFDVITLSHVIEHVHNPVDVLKDCYSLLNKGGFVWIETPNIESEGHHIYGEAWRGLEPPRHLVIFNVRSLYKVLKNIGFTEIECLPYRPTCEYMFNASVEIQKGIAPYSLKNIYKPNDLIRCAEKKEKRDPFLREFITVKAWKK